MTENIKDGFTDAVEKSTIFLWMQENEVDAISVCFNGEGDSGTFDTHANLTPKDNKWDRLDKLYAKFNDFETVWGKLPALVLRIAEEIEETIDHDVDWYNNDGGEGSVTFILDGLGPDDNYYKQGICLLVSARIIELETSSFAVEGVIETEEEIPADEPSVPAR